MICSDISCSFRREIDAIESKRSRANLVFWFSTLSMCVYRWCEGDMALPMPPIQCIIGQNIDVLAA